MSRFAASLSLAAGLVLFAADALAGGAATVHLTLQKGPDFPFAVVEVTSPSGAPLFGEVVLAEGSTVVARLEVQTSSRQGFALPLPQPAGPVYVCAIFRGEVVAGGSGPAPVQVQDCAWYTPSRLTLPPAGPDGSVTTGRGTRTGTQPPLFPTPLATRRTVTFQRR